MLPERALHLGTGLRDRKEVEKTDSLRRHSHVPGLADAAGQGRPALPDPPMVGRVVPGAPPGLIKELIWNSTIPSCCVCSGQVSLPNGIYLDGEPALENHPDFLADALRSAGADRRDRGVKPLLQGADCGDRGVKPVRQAHGRPLLQEAEWWGRSGQPGDGGIRSTLSCSGSNETVLRELDCIFVS